MNSIMDNLNLQLENEESKIILPPGFRFHPTEEELIHYLNRKVRNPNFRIQAIQQVDLKTSEPWELPGKSRIGEKEWYFFALRDRKYPTGMRTNRATEAGYWKGTGKDREVYSSKSDTCVGMKKTLVFYLGRAPKGEKTNWIMHEYRLVEEDSASLNQLRDSRSFKDSECVVCRVFYKMPGGKKAVLKHFLKAEHCDISKNIGEFPEPRFSHLLHELCPLPALVTDDPEIDTNPANPSQNDQIFSFDIANAAGSLLEDHNSDNCMVGDRVSAAHVDLAHLRQPKLALKIKHELKQTTAVLGIDPCSDPDQQLHIFKESALQDYVFYKAALPPPCGNIKLDMDIENELTLHDGQSLRDPITTILMEGGTDLYECLQPLNMSLQNIESSLLGVSDEDSPTIIYRPNPRISLPEESNSFWIYQS